MIIKLTQNSISLRGQIAAHADAIVIMLYLFILQDAFTIAFIV